MTTICMWRDRNIEDLKKEELLDVVRALGRALQQAREAHSSTLNMWELCRKAGSK